MSHASNVPQPRRRLNTSRLIRIILALLMTGYALFFSAQLLLHYYSFGSRALDLGNMGQAIWNTSQGNLFHQTNQPGATSRLSLHVEPILLPVSLLYRIFPGPEILFIFQSVVVALGAIPVFALARRALNSDWLALVFALAFLLMPAVQGATLLDFHAVTLAPTFLLAAFYFLETRRAGWYALFAALAVACKEDITLLVMMMGLYALVINRQKRLGWMTLALTGLWAFVAVFVIPPLFAGTDNIHWNRYSHLGSSPANIVLNLFIKPQLFINHLIAINAVGYFRLLLAPTAYTALLNPVTLLLALPSLGINLLSSFPPMQRVNSLIYAAPVIPAVMISSIYGTRNLRGWLGRINLPNLFATRNPARRTPATNLLLGGLILAASLGYHLNFGYLPGGGQYRGWEEVTDHHRLGERFFAQIPPQAKLSAMDRLNPHVSGRQTLYIFDRVEDADTILLDVTLDSWPLHPVALRDRVKDLLGDDGGFGVQDAADGFLLLAQTPNLPRELPDSFFNFARMPADFSPQFQTPVTFEGGLQLIGFDLKLGAYEKFLPVATLYWRTQQPQTDDLTLWPYFIDPGGHAVETPAERPPVTPIWYPTSRWQPGEIIAVSTLPVDLAPAVGDEFTLAVAVASGDGSDPAQRLTVTDAANLPVFDNHTAVRLNTFRRTGRKEYRPVVPESDPPQIHRQAQFWNLINLQGVDVPDSPLAPGESLPFGLHWQSSAPITVDLTTFAHLQDLGGNVVAQLDWGPQDALGYRPTSSWVAGQTIIDHQQILLPEDLPPGDYRLVVGWYYAPTGERLPVTASDSPTGATDGVVEVEVITLRP